MLKNIKHLLAGSTLALMMAMPMSISPALAETHTHAGAGLSFDAPDEWAASADGDVLVLTPEDETMVTMFWASEAENLEAVVGALDEELAKVISDINVEEDAKEEEVNGLPVVYSAGTGTVEGQAAHWMVAVVMADKPVILLTTFVGDGLANHASDFKTMLDSIRSN